jgi:threonine/homoserine efflux transporter RhtA|tara:strand:- start:8518 stop:8715 length:198 start_codon:yes stop_codon:yes gene_type:complete
MRNRRNKNSIGKKILYVIGLIFSLVIAYKIAPEEYKGIIVIIGFGILFVLYLAIGRRIDNTFYMR